jgi:Kef-type K+ transport system membrane component KefB
MKNYRNILFYIIVIGAFLSLMYCILQVGKPLEVSKLIAKANETDKSYFEVFKDSVHHNVTHPLAILLLQIFTIIVAARTLGIVFNKIGQPTVIGEVVAGIILGPSLLGMWFPEYIAFLFPKTSLPNLQFLSQVGLILFMFVIGMELDLKVLKSKAHDAIVISHASIIVPYALGVGLAYFLYQEFSPANINFVSFSLFMGIAMSITAFPVLARIIQERDMTKSKIGVLAITCAAADDITAWCILAAVIALVKVGSFVSALYTIALAIIFVLAMLKLVQPFIVKLGHMYSNRETLSLNIVGFIFGVLILSAYTAEVIGIHALFGAFLAGVIMPPEFSFRRILIEKIEYIALGLLLPLFFAFSGLRTQIGLLNDLHLWGVCFAIILIAIVGKFGGSMLAAKFVGQRWKDSLAIGALMNTRGLMELVVLNIGYDLGVLSPPVFAMMVLMALVTTFMTGPVLDLINKYSKNSSSDKLSGTKPTFKILMSFGNTQSGKKMIKIANMFAGSIKSSTEITALHITPSADINKFDAVKYEKESFKSIKAEAVKLGLQVNTLYQASNSVREEILTTANNGKYDLLLLNSSQLIFYNSFIENVIGALNPENFINTIAGKTNQSIENLIDEKVKGLISQSTIPVAIFMDKDFDEPKRVIISITLISDIFLLFYAKRIIKRGDCKVVIVDYNGIVNSNSALKEEINTLENFSSNNVEFISFKDVEFNQVMETSLLIASFDGWKTIGKKHFSTNEINIPVLLMRG